MDISINKDVVYGEQGRPLRWDIYRPAVAASGAPVVLVLHGGGWRAGDRSFMADACMAYARRGYVAIAPEYRLLGEAPWPAPLDDVKLAVRTLREQSGELGVSPDHIFLTGFSAGAHLSLLTAAGLSGATAGVAVFFPPARLGPEGGRLLGVSDPAVVAAASPIEHAAKLPPTIVFCGDADAQTPAELSLQLYKAIRAAGVPADVRLYADMIHEFVSLPGMLDQTIADAVSFFDRKVINKESFDAATVEHRKWWDSISGAAGTP